MLQIFCTQHYNEINGIEAKSPSQNYESFIQTWSRVLHWNAAISVEKLWGHSVKISSKNYYVIIWQNQFIVSLYETINFKEKYLFLDI